VTHEDPLSEHQSSALGGVWAFRARAEREAIARFSRLSSELRRLGAEPRVIELASSAVDDEERHARLCADIARHYGSPLSPGVGAAPPIGPPALPADDRVLYEVVAFCCVTETLNTSLMHVAYLRARVPYVREAIREILKDEVWHSRLGWAHLHSARAKGQGAFLSAALPRMLAGAVRMELFADSPAQHAEEAELLADHGELPLATRAEIFESSARDVLLPGLEELGIDTRPARQWIRAARSRRAPEHRAGSPYRSSAAAGSREETSARAHPSPARGPA
jgi:hypothetical protein